MSPLNVIYQDESILVIDKSPGIIVTTEQPGDNRALSGPNPVPTISDILKTGFQINIDRGGVVHRLDKDTSGVLLIAKNEPAMENLKLQFAKRLVKKQYLALTHGTIKNSGEVNVSMSRNPHNKLKMDVFDEGRNSITKYQPEQFLQMSDEVTSKLFSDLPHKEFKKLKLMNYQTFTLVNCFPQTGRTHQIRVHLKYINHPIVSDTKYGGRKTSKLDLVWCPRQFLHAKKIEFTHPLTNQTMIFESPLPADLKKALGFLKK